MKTAISISDDLFKRVEEVAGELHISRSQVFADAVRDYIEKHRNEKILETLNEVYSEAETEEERRIRMQSKRRHAKFLKAEKW